MMENAIEIHNLTKKFGENGDLIEEWFFEDGILTLKKVH